MRFYAKNLMLKFILLLELDPSFYESQDDILRYVYTLADSGFFKNFLYQGGVKSTVFRVFEDLTFKISEGYNLNWCFPDSAQLVVSVQLQHS